MTKASASPTKHALFWTVFWIVLALVFNGVLWWYFQQTANVAVANQKAIEFFTGYLIEKTLSIDNIFVFLLLFKYFSVSLPNQRRILRYGVWGAILMRAILIISGSWLIEHFHWVLYLFGGFLVVTAVKALTMKEKEIQPKNNRLFCWLQSYANVAHDYTGDKFFIRRQGFVQITPLFLVLVLVEASDLVFALDSIPAIFAITTDPFIVFTSNIFAILGLRALYFVLADIADRFYFLKYGLGLILLFIGIKMLIVHWVKIPALLALGVVVTILAGSVILSLFSTKFQKILKRQ